MVDEMVLYMSVALVPNTVTELMMTRKINETIRPYSIAVAPA